MYDRAFLLFLAVGAISIAHPNRVLGGGLTPDMTSMSPTMMSPGMMGIADQGDSVEMGQRFGKFMGSFMREMKNPSERTDSDESNRRDNYRSTREPTNSYRDREMDSRRDRYVEGDQRGHNETLRYVPLYDPWGADRGNPLMDSGGWNSTYENPYQRRGSYRDPGPYGWAADRNWDSGRSYYGAGLAPWEMNEPQPNSRSERRWFDPSYYDRDYDHRNM
ncbi:MAG: hypothetical protein HQL93_02055, partial [Magnetococcales bacterium]|nr:hypothetical protein [Magnetococcales bacterium]